MGPTLDPPVSCRTQVGPMSVPRTLLSGRLTQPLDLSASSTVLTIGHEFGDPGRHRGDEHWTIVPDQVGGSCQRRTGRGVTIAHRGVIWVWTLATTSIRVWSMATHWRCIMRTHDRMGGVRVGHCVRGIRATRHWVRGVVGHVAIGRVCVRRSNVAWFFCCGHLNSSGLWRQPCYA